MDQNRLNKYIGVANTGLNILGDFMYNTNDYALNFNYQPVWPGIGNREDILRTQKIRYKYLPMLNVGFGEYLGDSLSAGLAGFTIGGIPGAIIGTLGAAAGNFVKLNKIDRENLLGYAFENSANKQQLAITNYAEELTDKLNMIRQLQHPDVHYIENGGNLNTHGATFDNGMTYFNVGGTHGLNPYGGILQGFNEEDGEPNLVELGETKWNDYIFSNRYKAGGSLLKKYLLPEDYAGMTFADISKKLSEPLENTPGSMIEKRTTDTMLSRLMEAQEEKRAKDEENKAIREFKKGGHMFLRGGEDDYPLIYGDPITVTLPSNYIDWQTIEQNNPQTYINTNDIVDSNLDWIDYNSIKPNTINNTSNIPSNSQYLVNNNNSDIRSKFNPRLFMLLDPGLSRLGDILGITNRPDYGRSRMHRDAASNIRDVGIQIPYLQEYIPELIPKLSLLNNYRSMLASNIARINNTVNGNSVVAQVLANDATNKYYNAIGESLINSTQANNAELAKAAELNNNGKLSIAQLLQNNAQFNAQQGNNRYNALKDYIGDLSMQDALSSAAIQDTEDTLRKSVRDYLMELEDKNVLAQLLIDGVLKHNPNNVRYYIDNNFLQQYV